MASLTARFREVELTFESPVSVPPSLPPNWLQCVANGASVKFIDDSFRQESLDSDVARLFGAPQSAFITPMTLRTIFLAIAKASRTRTAS